jgi:hypothetical protein
VQYIMLASFFFEKKRDAVLRTLRELKAKRKERRLVIGIRVLVSASIGIFNSCRISRRRKTR